ncbi:hypothetical protein [Sphingomonas sp.]|jgi:starvation-inducible outer membrane lipoprotein|uniref:hypothetical protein n=1 Tax=Sphingomonas sp. TaxID=28214 RepID=UPI002D7E8CD1|nr:hypothetical protein [Sphingomonas sp.]HEU0042934.1 hypothetical protein [Sphingomonas sp.]
MRSAAILFAGAALLLAACSAEPDQPGGVTADEAQQLNQAAAMLDANSMDANALTQSQPAEAR